MLCFMSPFIEPIRVEVGIYNHGLYIPVEENIQQICIDGIEDQVHILLIFLLLAQDIMSLGYISYRLVLTYAPMTSSHDPSQIGLRATECYGISVYLGRDWAGRARLERIYFQDDILFAILWFNVYQYIKAKTIFK